MSYAKNCFIDFFTWESGEIYVTSFSVFHTEVTVSIGLKNVVGLL